MRRLGLAWLGVAGLLAAFAPAAAASSGSSGYTLAPVAFLGDPAPGGGAFTNDFEPAAINSSGEVAFTSDVDPNGDEAVFVARGGRISQVIRGGSPAPGGVTFGPYQLAKYAMNDQGDVAVGFSLSPFDPTVPFGVGGGVFRYSHATGALSAVELPGNPAPGGGTFAGTAVNIAINNRGDILFPGLATGSAIKPPGTPPNYNGMAMALYEQRPNGTSVRLVGPGDAAPGGLTFDDAWNGSSNNAGDVTFSGHVVGDPCTNIGPPTVCGDSLYLRDAATGTIRSIAHQGQPAPGGGTFSVAFAGLVNSSDQIAFVGGLNGNNSPFGIYRYTNRRLTAVALPGESMPGGGNFASAGDFAGMNGMNNRGEISFAAALNTDTTGDGLSDTGIYVESHGALHLIARSGTVIPGVGTISRLGQFQLTATNNPPDYGTGGMINDRGQVVLNATLTDGRGVLLIATPTT